MSRTIEAITRTENIPTATFTQTEALSGLVPAGQLTEKGKLIVVASKPGEVLEKFAQSVATERNFRRIPVEQRPGK